jgi:predicted nuclease of predicted toxin-antitoxin system
MRLLFDQNISHRIISQIVDIFPEAKQVRELGIENFSDRSIWEFAKEKEYTIVTFDGDFYDLSLVYGHPPKIIWLRCLNQTTKNIEVILRKFHTEIEIFFLEDDLACFEIIQKSA